MSIYEVVVFVALAAAGSYAYYLYRSDTRPKPPGTPATPPPKDSLMFGRTPPSDKK